MNNIKDVFLDLSNRLDIKNNNVIKNLDKKITLLKEVVDPKLKGTMKIRFKDGEEESILYVKFSKSLPDHFIIVKGIGPISQLSVKRKKEEVIKVRMVLMEAIGSIKSHDESYWINNERVLEQVRQNEDSKVVPFHIKSKTRNKVRKKK